MSDDQARILITLNPEWTAARRAFPELPLIVFVTPTSTSDGMKLVQAFFGDSSSCAATKHLQTHKVSLESIQALDANVVIIYYTKLHGGHFESTRRVAPVAVAVIIVVVGGGAGVGLSCLFVWWSVWLVVAVVVVVGVGVGVVGVGYKITANSEQQ
jgi:hypothetical protein